MTAFAETPDGERIAYVREPGERPVLLIHGFASTGELTWGATGWVRALAEAGRGAVVLDLRGHGASSAPHDARDYSPALLARDATAVLDAEGLDVVDVVGYSMGANVALGLAQSDERRVRRLVLGGIGTVEQFGRWGVEAVCEALLGASGQAEPSGPEVPADSPLAPLLASLRQAPGLDRAALAACVRGMAAHPVALESPVPTMLVVGEVDPVTEGRDEAARMLGAELVVIPRRNHVTTLSARAFKQAAVPFLEGEDK